jgi:hypothetical protein
VKLKAWLMAKCSFSCAAFSRLNGLLRAVLLGMFDSPGVFERLGVLRMEFYKY